MEVLPTLTDLDLTSIGIKALGDRKKILKYANAGSSDSPSSSTSPKVKNKGKSGYHAFISYRRDGGSDLARIIKTYFDSKGFSVFLDVESLSTGRFDEGLIKTISDTTNFILILSPNCLDRCVEYDKNDWLRKEIVLALDSKRNIIPVMTPSYRPPDKLPDDIKPISSYNAVPYNHIYFDAVMDKIINFFQ